ncbi:MAG: SEL1-like repeat protein [Akkermansia sp.]
MELGIMYRDGKYVPRDMEKARKWFEKGRSGRTRTAWPPWRICSWKIPRPGSMPPVL